MSNIQYAHTAVLVPQFNANGTDLDWAKLQSVKCVNWQQQQKQKQNQEIYGW